MTTEPKKPAQTTDKSDVELDASSLSAIRSILTEEATPAPQRKRGRIKQEATPVVDDAPQEVATPVRRKKDAFPPLESAQTLIASNEYAADPAPKRWFSLKRKASKGKKRVSSQQTASIRHAESRDSGGLKERLLAYRPSVAHVVIAALVLLVLMRPWLVFGLLFLFVIIMVGVLLIAGYDGFWGGVMKINRWYANRRPSRAAEMHTRLDRFAVRWDAILDRFPEGTVDSLYLPDFGELETADARHDEALERRLAGLHEKGA